MTLWFTGTDSRLNSLVALVIPSFPVGPSFGQKSTYDDTSVAGPTMFDGYLGWSGTDDAHHLNVRLMQ